MNVTVLMPVFNRARFIDEAVRSVLRQSYDDFELVLVDDGSTDETPSMLARWQREDPRVVVVTSAQNEGIPAALNRGLAVARGKYVARLDSDDVMMPGRLAAQAEVLDSNEDVVLVSSAVELISVDGEHRGIWRGEEPHEVMQLLLNFYNIVGGGGQVMFRTAAVREEGGYSELYPSSEDFALWTRLLRRGRIVTLPTIGMKMRDHGERSMTKYAAVKRANWHGIMGASLGEYLGRIVEPSEIEALIALWQRNGTKGLAARADAVMQEAFAVFGRRHPHTRLRRIAALRIAEQWKAAAKSFEALGEMEDARANEAFGRAWWEEALTVRADDVPAPVAQPLLCGSGKLTGRDVVVGCVMENTSKDLARTMRLVQSIRWFGGDLANARVVVGTVGVITPRAKKRFESLGAEVRLLPHARSGVNNQLHMLEEVIEGAERVVLSLDGDLLVVGDVLPFLSGDAFGAKVAPRATVSHETFVRLFEHFQIALPARTFVTGVTNLPTIGYFDAAVIAMPREIASRLVPEWRRHSTNLLAVPELLGAKVQHLHEAALTLALVTSGVAIRELPVDLNFQIEPQFPALPRDSSGFSGLTPGRYLAIEPLVINGRHELGEGNIDSAAAQSAIERFETKLSEERWRALHHAAPRTRRSQGPSRIAVVGMHRSGTSVTGQLLTSMGCHSGSSDDLPAGDRFNPTGYWEHRDVRKLDDEILASLNAGWLDPVGSDVTAIPDEQYERFLSSARQIVRQMDVRGTSWMIKDPRLSLIFPLWREAMEDPIVVLPWRHPSSVARSLQHRDGIPLQIGVALWEEYTRLMLASSIGTRRIALSYAALTKDPSATTRHLYQQLVAAGAEDLTMPSEAELREIVEPAFVRSHHADVSLTVEQEELVAAIESGAAFHWHEVPPSSEATRELLQHFVNDERDRLSNERRFEELDERLSAARREMFELQQKQEAIISGIRLDYAALEDRTQYEREVREESMRAERVAHEALLAQREALIETGRQEREALEEMLLAEQESRNALVVAGQRERDEAELTLRGVFASRSWRVGRAITRMLRAFVPSGIESAEERWKRERGSDD